MLPVNKKRSKAPGDSKEMLLARRHFLNAAHYAFLLNEIEAVISSVLHKEQSCILDLGCGEGYYSHQLSNRNEELSKLQFYGCDIAKPAVQMAAKQNKKGQFCVASAAELPYLDNSFDLVLNIFAPYNESEIVRVVKEQGHFLLVGPGPNHLRELAQFIYSEVQPHRGNPAKETQNKGLRQVSVKHSAVKLDVDEQYLESLLMMTPYYWSINETNKARLLALKSLEVTFEFTLELLLCGANKGEPN